VDIGCEGVELFHDRLVAAGKEVVTKHGWDGDGETVVLEWMPEQYRSSHEAAGNRGVWPHNGAMRLICEKSCAERIVEADPEWAEVVG
jgi:hypothetical protein